jgi:hypothetical protein
MIDQILMQTSASGVQPPSDSVSVLVGLLATALPAISLILRNYYSGQLKKKGEVIEAGKKVTNLDGVVKDFTPLPAKLIIANNDGKITEEEYDVIVNEAKSKLIWYARESGIDLKDMVPSLEVLMKKTSSGPMMILTNGNGGAGNGEAAEEVVGPVTAIRSPGPKHSKSRRMFNCSR